MNLILAKDLTRTSKRHLLTMPLSSFTMPPFYLRGCVLTIFSSCKKGSEEILLGNDCPCCQQLPPHAWTSQRFLSCWWSALGDLPSLLPFSKAKYITMFKKKVESQHWPSFTFQETYPYIKELVTLFPNTKWSFIFSTDVYCQIAKKTFTISLLN